MPVKSRFIPLVVLALAAGAWASVQAAESAPPCLDYWHVGATTGCQPIEGKKAAKPATPSPTAVAQAPSPTAPAGPKTMEQRIKEFKEDYGKPPSEFIAFYLEPTPENAMRWVHKYQEILNRSQQLAYVWTQAETLYQKELANGRPASSFETNPLTPVKDFGIPVAGIDSPIAGGTAAGALPPDLAALPTLPGSPNSMPTGGESPEGPASITKSFTGFGNTPVGNLGSLTGLPNLGAGNNNLAGSLQGAALGGVQAPTGATLGGLQGAGLGGPDATAPTAQNPVRLTYYFSATCPYCQKFHPELKAMLDKLGDLATTTCVDMTPQFGPVTPDMPAPRASNVADLKCTWRKTTDEEENRFGIRQTPTLLIQRKKDGAYERFSGYTPADQILAHILSPATSSITPD